MIPARRRACPLYLFSIGHVTPKLLLLLLLSPLMGCSPCLTKLEVHHDETSFSQRSSVPEAVLPDRSSDPQEERSPASDARWDPSLKCPATTL